MSNIPIFITLDNSSQYLKWKGEKGNSTFLKFTVILDEVMCLTEVHNIQIKRLTNTAVQLSLNLKASYQYERYFDPCKRVFF